MQIGIVTCSTTNRKWLYDITNSTKRKYCAYHNIDYIFSDSFYPDVSRHPYWNKVKFIDNALTHYDWVLWMDDDAGFISYQDINPIFNSTAQLLYAVDMNGFNAGVMGFKNTPSVHKCLDFIWNKMYPIYKNDKFPEQNAIKQLFIKDLGVGEQIDGSIFNAYDSSLTISPHNQANTNTIILHIAGGSDFKLQHKEDIKRLYEAI